MFPLSEIVSQFFSLFFPPKTGVKSPLWLGKRVKETICERELKIQGVNGTNHRRDSDPGRNPVPTLHSLFRCISGPETGYGRPYVPSKRNQKTYFYPNDRHG